MDAPANTPGPTPTGYQRTQAGGFKWMAPSAEQLATLLPQYDIESLLGRGGMGAVYKGRQKSLDRAVAIKILPPEVDHDDASYTERFKNEARIMARLDHPAIVPVYDFGETSAGQLYIVMAFVDGTDVAQMINSQKRLPPEHALAIAAHVCDALGYAHTHGVVHRDIKPANVLINMEGQVKVADFGLAKLDESGTTGLTKTGIAMGTPDYVAPEALIMGTQIDGRADLYAIGVMLYHMLTGEVPRGAFDLPGKRLGTDPRFDAIILKAMKMDRAERYQSSAELRRDLDVILTVPLVQTGGHSSVAIPVQSLPARNASHSVASGPPKPVAKGPQQSPRSHVRQNVEQRPQHHALASAATPKSKTPLLIGLAAAAAAAAIGAFIIFRPAPQREAKVVQSFSSIPATPNPTPAPTIVPPPTESKRTPTVTTTTGSASTVTPPKTIATTPAATPTKPAAAMAEAKPAAPPPSAATSIPAKPSPVPARLPDPAKWVKVFETPESLALFGDNALWTDGGIKLKSTITVPSITLTDGALRARIRLGTIVYLGLRNGAQRFRVAKVDGVTQIITVQKRSGTSSDETMATFSFKSSSTTTTDIEVELLAVGKVISVSVDGKVVGSLLDNEEPYGGTVSLYSSTDGLVRDIAWQSLEAPNPADEKLATLERAYQERIKSEADAPFETAVAELAAKLKAALERTVPNVRGTPTEALLRAEISRIEKKDPIPPADEPKIPGLLVTLRKTWHTELAKLLVTRIQNAAPAKQAQDQALAALQKELEDKGDITRAERIKLARAHLQKADALPVSGGLAAVKKGPLNVRHTKAGKLKMIGCMGNAGMPLNAEPFAAYNDFVQVVANPLAFAALRANGGAIIQRKNKEVLETFIHETPPLSKLIVRQGSVWGLTEDGRVVQLRVSGENVRGPWDKLDGVSDFSGGDQGKFCAGLRADGTVMLVAANTPGEWLPKPESLPKAKAVSCDNQSLIILTESGAIMAWHESGLEVKAPPPLRRGIVRWVGPGLSLNTTEKVMVWSGAFLDKQGDLHTETGGVFKMAADHVEDVEGTIVNFHWRRKGKPWVINGISQFGEIEKAQEVLAKSAPISWQCCSSSLGGGMGSTGIFVWIE